MDFHLFVKLSWLSIKYYTPCKRIKVPIAERNETGEISIHDLITLMF